MGKENGSATPKEEGSDDGYSSLETVELESQSRPSLEKDTGLPSCRVCQCAESDKRGDAALEFLGITPVIKACKWNGEDGEVRSEGQGIQKNMSFNKNVGNKSGMVEFVGPNGEVFMCRSDVEIGLSHQDALIELGCCCKNDLALVHYACALKWFINHGSTICEICGHIANNIRISDFNKVVGSLKEYEALRERTVSGDPGPHVHANNNTGVDPDAVAAIRRQRLSEIALWFCPHNTSSINNNSNADTVSQVASEQPSNFVTEDAGPAQSPATKWAVEGTGILLATGLLTITLAWLIAPRVGKKTAKSGLHILLGGVCALTVVVFFRFFVLTRIKYGPARYWAILFVFWFLVFAIWASRTLVLRHMVPIHNASPWYCAQSQGFQVEERLVSVDELLDADEVFCTVLLILATGIGAVFQQLYSVLTRLQMGITEDVMNWTVELR